MSVALPLSRDRLRPATSIGLGRIAAVDILLDIAEAEPLWRAMQRDGASATPYQQYDFLALWYHHAGRWAGVTPLIVAGRDGTGTPLFLWPLGMADRGPVRVVGFLGGKYANLNFGLWQRDFAASVTRAEMEGAIAGIADSGLGIDLIALHRQPVDWRGIPNPFAQLNHQPSPEDSRRVDLRHRPIGAATHGGASPLRGALRKQLRAKEHKLSMLPGYRYLQAATRTESDQLLDWFFSVKSRRLSAQGAGNVFDQQGIEQFLREACGRGLEGGCPAVEMHALQTDNEVLAVIAGVGDGTRFSSILTTYTLSPESRHSPGLVLVHRLIGNLAARGYSAFDLGVGDARYKRMFCKQAEPLFDCFLPLTARGKPAAVAARMSGRLVREIKRRPALWSAASAVRRRFHAVVRR